MSEEHVGCVYNRTHFVYPGVCETPAVGWQMPAGRGGRLCLSAAAAAGGWEQGILRV